MGNPSQAPMGGSPMGGGKAGLAGMMQGSGTPGGPSGLIMPEIPGINNNKHLTPSTGPMPAPNHGPGGQPITPIESGSDFVNNLLARLLNRRDVYGENNKHSY